MAAIADRIIDESTKSFTDDVIQNAKAKWREMVLNINAAVKERNEVLHAIRKMPSGANKEKAIAEFQQAESYFISAYQQAKPLFDRVGDFTGDSFPVADTATFGIAPLVGWALVAASLAAVSYIAVSMYEAKLKYQAIKDNPSVAAQLSSGGLFSQLGEGGKYALIIVGLAVAGAYLIPALRKA